MRTRWPAGKQPPRPDVTSAPLPAGSQDGSSGTIESGEMGPGAAPLPWEGTAQFIPNKAALVQGTGARALLTAW